MVGGKRCVVSGCGNGIWGLGSRGLVTVANRARAQVLEGPVLVCPPQLAAGRLPGGQD